MPNRLTTYRNVDGMAFYSTDDLASLVNATVRSEVSITADRGKQEPHLTNAAVTPPYVRVASLFVHEKNATSEMKEHLHPPSSKKWHCC